MFASLGLRRSHLPDRTGFDSESLPAEEGRGLKYYAGLGKDLIGDALGRAGSRRLGVSSTFGRSKPVMSPIAAPQKIIWVRPDDITYKIRGDLGLHANDILDGDWDLHRAPVAETKKYVSIRRHFQEGCPWEDTALFESYSKRFRRGEIVRGASSLPRLKQQYETRVEAVFRDLGASGFRIARDLLGRPTNLPHVHIGRGGEILYGSKGNHRLAMAKLLSLSVIPCHVRTRHAEWQRVREMVLNAVALTKDDAAPSNAHAAFMGHPDLADLYYPNQ